MRRFTGACVVACAGTTAVGACDLDLPPYVADAGGQQFLDASFGTDVEKPAEDAKPPEDSAAPDVVADAGDSGAKRKRVFATTATFNGAFGANGQAALAAADARCQAAAVAANLGGGPFVAWLSTTNPAAPASTRLKEVGGWTLVDGKTQVAASLAVLSAGTIEVPINLDEKGVAVVAPELAWTGTAANGQANNNNCANFTTSANVLQGLAGQTKEKDINWTQGQQVACVAALHLYCFEQ
jgi:hypothetical protein